jgi:cytochrome b6-f complex iron-sulfur subunit
MPSESEGEQAPLTRRWLVRLGWIAGLIVVGGQLGWLLKLLLSPRKPGGAAGPVTAGPVAQFPVGSVTHFWKKRFLLVRRPGGFLALSQKCTHQKCNVHFIPERREIICPCHGSRFSLTGAVLTGPAPRPLDRFATVVRDGQVVVDTSQRMRTAG